MPIDTALYAHQARAIRRVMDGHNVVVASGTGSGKTECFPIPIIDDLLRDTTPGVRALLVYPMNALVNDQLDRLRSLLRGSGISFGRYTSELAQTEAEARRRLADQISAGRIPREEVISRERVRGNAPQGIPPEPPQILITNYAMLEYLLLRPEDSPLFLSGCWRYVVLDEAHTYAGAQGIELSLLLRRLKHRPGRHPGEVRCIATSATLTQDDQSAAADFAATLFGESFAREDVVFGEVEEEPPAPAAAGPAPDPAAYLRVSDDALVIVRTATTPANDLVAHMTATDGRPNWLTRGSGKAAGSPFASLRKPGHIESVGTAAISSRPEDLVCPSGSLLVPSAIPQPNGRTSRGSSTYNPTASRPTGEIPADPPDSTQSAARITSGFSSGRPAKVRSRTREW